MKKTLSCFCFFMSMLTLHSQVIGIEIDTEQRSGSFKTGENVLRYMHEKYKLAPCKSYTFSQKNKHYRNDSIVGTSEWHEAIEFPDKFRIDFGDSASGNFVIFKNDSSYRYKQGILIKTSYNPNTLLLLLGGMYYREPDDVINRLKKENFNTSLLSTQKWRKQHVYVVGAFSGDTVSSQIWISKKNFRVLRILEKMENGHTMDMTFDEHQEHCNGYVETKVTFKIDGRIEQTEDYYNIKHVDSFLKETFSPLHK